MLHLHEPMTPAICIAVLALATAPIVATHHASGDLGWMKLGMPAWGFLMDRIDQRIAVSEKARDSADRWLGGPWEVIPNGVLIPETADPPAASTRSSSPGATSRARGCRCCCAPGRSSTAARVRRSRSPAPTRSLSACSSAGCGSRTRHRDRRVPLPGGPHRAALLDEGAHRALARRRELRHGAHARVRVRDASRRLRHRGLSRRRHSRDGDHRAARTIPMRSPPGSRRCSRTSRGASRWARRRERWRRSATAGGHRRQARGRVHARDRRHGAGARREPARAAALNPVPGRHRRRALLARVRRDLVAWARLARGLPRVRLRELALDHRRGRRSTSCRCSPGALVEHDDPAGAAPAPSAVRPGVLGIRGRAARERGAPGPCRRAGACRGAAAAPSARAGNERDPRRDGVRPPAVRLLPGLASRRLRSAHREGASLGGLGARDPQPGRAWRCSPLAASRRGGTGIPAHIDSLGTVRRLWTMAREGLAVLRTFPAALAAILFQTAGWAVSSSPCGR